MGIENTSSRHITELVKAQRAYFREGATLGLAFRREMLKRLLNALHTWERPLTEALYQDLHKSYEEALLTEISIVIVEIKNHLKNLDSWAEDEERATPFKLFPSRSKIIAEPLGNTLIIAPWNYPVQLLLNPLVGAISAGCTAILKPSPYVPNVARVLGQMVEDVFDERYIAIVQGNREVNQELLTHRFDLIFFTGSPSLGKQVMEAAAKHLTPVVLELGGKSPCIVDKEADIKLAAKRIAWGKSINAGQTCIAPDYLLVHSSIKEAFIKELQQQFKLLLGDNPQETKHFVRIVNDRAFARLISYLDNGDIRFGGRYDAQERYIEPTLLDNISPEAPIMQEEIFGPIFPLLTFTTTEEAIAFVNDREKPLALYYFGSTKRADRVLRRTSSGGACINDVIMHIANEEMPFGGVGNSGMSSYHGKESFLAFSHRRSVLSSSTKIDLPFRYMPYRWLWLAKWFL